MKMMKILALVGVGVGLSACASVDTVTRGAPFETIPQEPVQRLAVPALTDSALTTNSGDTTLLASPVRIEGILVQVPRSLKVSEANSYLPRGDIVWRGDAPGDRHAQVKAIFETAMTRGAQSLQGERPVDLLINVKRFHGLTEKTRYTIGGVHNITFEMALADPETGAILMPWREVQADLEGFGGQKAIAAELAGQTQKVRITDHLARVLQAEITSPEGHQNADLGLFQALNKSI